MQTHADWGQGFHCKINGNIAMNAIAAHCNHRLICIKDALLISVRMELPLALITLLLPLFCLGLLSISLANYRFQIKGHTWFSSVNIMTWKHHHPHSSCYRSIALRYFSTPPGNQHYNIKLWVHGYL